MIRKTRKLVRLLAHNHVAVRRDLSLTLTTLPMLPRVLSPLLPKEPAVKAELSLASYPSLAVAAEALGEVLVPHKRESGSNGTWQAVPPRRVEEPKVVWFYLNGAATSLAVAQLQAEELARLFARRIRLLHNPTQGLARDLWDTFAARTLRKDGHLSRQACYRVQEALENNDRVVLLCHSQGSIIASYVVRKLLRFASTRHLLSKLEVYSIGGVADSFEIDERQTFSEGRAVPYVEHFANGRDFFCRVGILSHLNSSAGVVFCDDRKTGHLLNQHFLSGIARGEYCRGQSRLYHYLHGKQPESGYYPL